jgi:hypothetical protein
MASFVYDKGRKAFADGGIAWLTDDIKVVLVTSGYSPSQSGDDFLSVIVAGNRVAASGNLAGKSSTAGVLDATDVTYPALTGAAFNAAVIYKDTGVEASSQLIAYIDNFTGLPYTPSGIDVTLVWDNGANKILKL